MSNKKSITLSILIIAIILGSTLIVFQPIPVQAQLPEGIPREDILIAATNAGASVVPDNFNFWLSASKSLASGISEEPLWLLNISSQEYIPMLASSLPQYSDDYTTLRIPVRHGIYWSDGVEFTADDVVFTINLHLNNPDLTASSYIRTRVQSVYKEDNYTAIIKLKSSNPLFHLGSSFPLIMPEHIWSKVADPVKFTNNPPVATGPYILDSYDSNGYWVLFKLRDDWARSAVGQVFGKPQPKYFLQEFYSPDDPKMAIAIANHQLDYAGIPVDLLDTVKSNNPYLETFQKEFPYTWRNGVYDISVLFNNDKSPYNITDVRWALALSINITDVHIGALNGGGRVATFHALSKPFLYPSYKSTLLPWIENFALSDGYKPFDDTVPTQLADYAKSKGYTLPEDPGSPGWWKFDTAKASALLERNGFSRDAQGKWHLPNGDLWSINYLVTIDNTLHLQLGLSVAEQWKRFGINVVTETLTSAVRTSRYNLGDFDATVSSSFGTQYIDVWPQWQVYHEKYYKPSGTAATSNQIRWVNHEFSALLDELATLPPEDPRVISIGSQLTKISLAELPVINLFVASQMFEHDTYYWSNWPTADNNYWEIGGGSGLNGYLPLFVEVKATGNVPSTQNSTNPYLIAGAAAGIAILAVVSIVVVRKRKAKKPKNSTTVPRL